MNIRRAEKKDLNGINNLLRQVLEMHHNGRPDIFKSNAKKYTDDELLDIIADAKDPFLLRKKRLKILSLKALQKVWGTEHLAVPARSQGQILWLC